VIECQMNHKSITRIYTICVWNIHWCQNCKSIYNYVTEDIKYNQNNEIMYTDRK